MNVPDNVRLKILESFIHLCSLTKILEDILSIVYALRPVEDETWKSIRKLEYLLDAWEDNLPGHLMPEVQDKGYQLDINGSTNLWFCYLSLKLLLYRVSLRVRHSKLSCFISRQLTPCIDDFAE